MPIFEFTCYLVLMSPGFSKLGHSPIFDFDMDSLTCAKCPHVLITRTQYIEDRWPKIEKCKGFEPDLPISNSGNYKYSTGPVEHANL